MRMHVILMSGCVAMSLSACSDSALDSEDSWFGRDSRYASRLILGEGYKTVHVASKEVGTFKGKRLTAGAELQIEYDPATPDRVVLEGIAQGSDTLHIIEDLTQYEVEKRLYSVVKVDNAHLTELEEYRESSADGRTVYFKGELDQTFNYRLHNSTHGDILGYLEGIYHTNIASPEGASTTNAITVVPQENKVHVSLEDSEGTSATVQLIDSGTEYIFQRVDDNLTEAVAVNVYSHVPDTWGEKTADPLIVDTNKFDMPEDGIYADSVLLVSEYLTYKELPDHPKVWGLTTQDQHYAEIKSLTPNICQIEHSEGIPFGQNMYIYTLQWLEPNVSEDSSCTLELVPTGDDSMVELVDTQFEMSPIFY